MHRDLRIVAALALPLSATRTWQETPSVDRARGLAEPDRWRLPSPTPRGLIHSDGCRTINRVRDGRYAYPRYFFTNRSTDILEIFRQAVRCRPVCTFPSKPDTISIARRQAVAAFDAFIGPKGDAVDLPRRRGDGTGRHDGLKSHCAKARAGSNPAPGTQTTWPSRTRSPRSNRSRPRLEMSTVVAAPSTISSASSLPTTGACWKPWPLKPFAR